MDGKGGLGDSSKKKKPKDNREHTQESHSSETKRFNPLESHLQNAKETGDSQHNSSDTGKLGGNSQTDQFGLVKGVTKILGELTSRVSEQLKEVTQELENGRKPKADVTDTTEPQRLSPGEIGTPPDKVRHVLEAIQSNRQQQQKDLKRSHDALDDDENSIEHQHLSSEEIQNRRRFDDGNAGNAIKRRRLSSKEEGQKARDRRVASSLFLDYEAHRSKHLPR